MFSKLTPNCRVTEVNTTSDNLQMAYQKQSLESDAFLTTIFGSLKTGSNLLRTAINRSKAESNLDEKDVVRDEKVQAVNYLLLGAVHHPTVEVRTAAESLYAVFSKYGVKMIHESYAIESSLIESMLEDYAAPELQADIALVSGCVEVIANIQTAQNDFKIANFTWEEEKAKEGLSQSASEIKKSVLSIINDKIMVYLEAMYQVDIAKYGELSQIIAQIIDNTNETVKRRAKKNEEVVIEN
jgi:hypothetical protein